MDPIVGGLIGGVGSIAGALINSSSAQAINTAQMQQQMSMAQGSYLPGLISNAAKAGINPLVAMGVKTPTVPSLNVPQPGTGVSQAASILSENFAHTRQMQKLAEQNSTAQVALAQSQNTNTGIQIQRDQMMNRVYENYFRRHPDAVPPGVAQPASETVTPIPQASALSRAFQTFGPSYKGQTGLFGGFFNPWDTYSTWRQ